MGYSGTILFPGRADHPSKESYQLSNRFTNKNLPTPQGKKGRLRKKERTNKETEIDFKLITVTMFHSRRFKRVVYAVSG
jgi:hypothetical protein